MFWHKILTNIINIPEGKIKMLKVHCKHICKPVLQCILQETINKMYF